MISFFQYGSSWVSERVVADCRLRIVTLATGLRIVTLSLTLVGIA